MTLEEIGRRAVALTEARARLRDERQCDVWDDEGPPCYMTDGLAREDWCAACARARGLWIEKRAAARRLSSAVSAWRRQERNKP